MSSTPSLSLWSYSLGTVFRALALIVVASGALIGAPSVSATSTLFYKNPSTGFEATVRFNATPGDCSFIVPAFDFGQLDVARQRTQVQSLTRDLEVRCPLGVPYIVAFDNGPGNAFFSTLVPESAVSQRVLRREISPGVYAAAAEALQFFLMDGGRGVVPGANGKGTGDWQRIPFIVEIPGGDTVGNQNHTIVPGRYVARLGVTLSF